MRFWIMTTAVLAALLHAGMARAQSIKAGTTWINQFESTLTIDTLNPETGALKGMYISRLGQHCVGTKHEAVGWVDADRIVFSVRWKTAAADCKSITSWAGYFINGKIVAFWDLVYVSGVDGANFVHRGTDIFEPCLAGKPKGCPQQAAADAPRPSEQDVARVAAEQRARAAAEAKRQADEEAARVAAQQRAVAEAKRQAEEEAARAVVEQRARAAAEAKRQADEEAARAAEMARPPMDARRLAEAAEAALKLSGRDRRRVQVALTSLGFDTQGVDELLGARTRQMIAAWQRKQGAPDTGFLTAPQFAALQRQAAGALARFDAIEKQTEARRKAEEEAQRRTTEIGDGQEPQSQIPPQVAATTPPGITDAPAAPRHEQYKGFTRILLYDGSDPNAFAEYTLTVTVADGKVSAVVTRYCPTCTSEGGEEHKSFACPADRLRGRSFNLKCDGAYTWGNFERAKVHYSTTHVDIPLVRVRGP